MIAATYSSEAKRLWYEATVVFLVDVDRNGKPVNIKLYRPAGHGLDDRALAAVNKWRFEPARLNGEPVVAAATIEVNFRFCPV